MTKQRLDQLYCTHCTYRTSALHRREGASGEQVFEESTRAGSVPREKSHDVYSRFGSNLLYHVPGDMPAAEMVKHTASSLNLRRLVYLPSVGGYRLLAQVCFRPTDTRGRPGASFSHVLIQDLKEFPDPWAPVDCLKLWGSEKWVIEDKPNLPHDLPPFSDFGEFDPGFKSLINDQLLLNFLKAPANTDFIDHEKIIPKRWQKLPPEARQKLLVYLLQAVLNLDFDRRESLFIAVEPSMAALLFYGIFRLLPAIGIAEKLSFSTYQSHRDRLMTTLAATCFHDPDATDLPPDWYSPHARGAAYNTFKADRQTPLKKTGQFATSMVTRLVTEGPSAVDSFLLDCRRLGVGTSEELEGLSAIDGHVTNLLKSQTKEQLSILERSLPRAHGLRALLCEKLVECIGSDSDSPQLSKLLEHPQHAIFILKLLSEAGASETTGNLEATIRTMVFRWPETASAELLNEKDIPRSQKVDFICRFVEGDLTLPGDVESLFFAPGSICRKDNLLEDVLRRLHGGRLKQFVLKTFSAYPTESCFCELLRKLSTLSSSQDHDQAFQVLFQRLQVRVTQPEDRRQILNAALADKSVRDKVKTWFEDDAISDHLLEMLNTLEKTPRQLDQNLALLDELKGFIPQCKLRINSWRTISNQLKELQRLNSIQVSFFQKVLGHDHQLEKDKAAQELAFAAKKAFPAPQYGYTDADATKVTRLLIEVLGQECMPEGFHSRCENVFAKDVWANRDPHKRSVKKAITPLRSIIAVVLTLLVICVFKVIESWMSPGDPELTVNGDTGPKMIDIFQQPDRKPVGPARNKTQQAEKEQAEKEQAEKEQAEKDKAEQKRLALERERKSLVDAANAEAMRAEDEKGNISTPKNGTANTSKIEDSSRPNELLAVVPQVIELPQIIKAGPRQPIKLGTWAALMSNDIKLRLLGYDELNAFLSRHEHPKLKDMRIHVAYKKLAEHDGIPTIRVFRIDSQDFEARKSTPTEGLPDVANLLCTFNIEKGSLIFEWEFPANETGEHTGMQEMLRLCCLQMNIDTHYRYINLIAPRKLFAGNLLQSAYAYDKAAKTNGATFDFEPNIPEVGAFDWIITQGRVAKSGEPDNSVNQFALDVNQIEPNKNKSISLFDEKLAKDFTAQLTEKSFECATVRFDQELIQNKEGKWKLNVVVIPDFSGIKLQTRMATFARLKNELDEPLKVLSGQVDIVKLNVMTPEKKDLTERAGNVRPFSNIHKIENMALELDACFIQDSGAPPHKTRDALVKYNIKISEPTTLSDLSRQGQLDNLIAYLAEVRRSHSDIERCKVESRAKNQLRPVNNSGSELDTQSRDFLRQFKRIEAYEMSRRMNQQWIRMPATDTARVSDSR